MAFVSVSSIYAAKAKVHAARCERSVTCMVADAGLAAMDDGEAMRTFQASMAEERKEMLEGNENAMMNRYDMWEAGVSEKEMLTFFGQLQNNYAKRHGMRDYDILTTQGESITDIPGVSYARGIGALDFLEMSSPVAVMVSSRDTLLAAAPEEEEEAEAEAQAEAEATEEEEVGSLAVAE